MANTSNNSTFGGFLKGNKPSSRGVRIFLIGFMGSGKTYWGKIWAPLKDFDFYDLDEVIEAKEGKSIAAIFEKQGEAYFRRTETEALHTFSEKDNCIIACGGGAACFNDNMQWMNENGLTVYLFASPQYILQRIKEETDKRPLINNLNEAELLFFIEQKLKEREPFYNKAKIILPARKLNNDSLTEILNL
jgi:shikimate kinase